MDTSGKKPSAFSIRVIIVAGVFSCALAVIGMTVHTAVAFAALGSGVATFAWIGGPDRKKVSPAWLPVAIGLAAVVITMTLYQALSAREKAAIEHTVESKVEANRDEIQDHMNLLVLALERMAGRWNKNGRPDRSLWEYDATLYVRHYAGFEAIEWVDASLRERWVVTSGGNVRPEPGVVKQIEGGLRKDVAPGKARVSYAVEPRPGVKGLAVSVPLFRGKTFDGFIVGVLRSGDTLKPLLRDLFDEGFSVEVSSGGNELYREAQTGTGTEFAHATGFALYNTPWTVRIWPNREYLDEAWSPLPGVVLGMGLVTSFLLMGVVYFHQTARRREGDVKAANLVLKHEVLERTHAEKRVARLNGLYSVLSGVNEAIVRERDMEKLYREVCRIAVEDGGFRMAWVGVADPEGRTIRPAAHWENEPGFLDSIDASTTGRGPLGRVISDGMNYICNDTGRGPDAGPWEKAAMERGYRSTAAFPLRVNSMNAGALCLYSGEPDSFDDEQILLLDSLAADISFALESAEREKRRKAAEEELARYSEHLEEMVEERTAELEELNEKLTLEVRVRKEAEDAMAKVNTVLGKKNRELEGVNKELESFTYSASHDLQEPLRIVAGYVQLLGRRYKGRLEPEADEFIDYAVDATVRMQALINDILSYSRVGARHLKFKHVDCERVLGRALSDLKAAVQEAGAIIIHDPLPTVMADETQMERLFDNLLGNAVKYCAGKAPEVRVSAIEGPDGWLFKFRDNGIGIDPRHHDRIWIMFQRLHGKNEYSGTGIGLAICKKVVENHGGRIWVESTLGQGSTFCFTIPHRRG
ncbi:MAG: GAF domain-containing protein [Deltaproteobacteria bacterium]|nr:GAF domain-containing protein [Deltaproteobacteria bacterium]